MTVPTKYFDIKWLNLSGRVALKLGWTINTEPMLNKNTMWKNNKGVDIDYPRFEYCFEDCVGKGGPLEKLIEAEQQPKIIASKDGFKVKTVSGVSPTCKTLMQAVCESFLNYVNSDQNV